MHCLIELIFLNKYFKLGLKDREVSFKRIWQSANNEIYEVFKIILP